MKTQTAGSGHDQELISLRRTLHAHPEVSGSEKNTASIVAEFLNTHKPDEMLQQLGGTGIAAIFRGKEAGKTILFRCELDALPIQEINTFEYSSKTDGVSHKCGHDGHMAIIAGLAKIFSASRPEKGTAILLFQPAEENGQGAAAVLADPRFKLIEPDHVFALHNLPGYPKNQIVVKPGTFTPAVNSVVVKLLGKTSHAGEPHHGINPAPAIAEIIREFEIRTIEDPHDPDYFLATPVHISMGEKAYGISAGEGEVHYTIRCHSNDLLQIKEAETEAMIRAVAARYKLEYRISWTERFYANENDTGCAEVVARAARKHDLELLEPTTPFNWGEDFGLFTARYPGTLFGFGAGSHCPALHNPDYDFPDEIISTGVSMFQTIMEMVQHG